MLTPVRRRLAAASLALLVPALGACGFDAQTDQVYQPGVGANERGDSVDVLGAVVVSEEKGSGRFISSLVNTELDQEDQLDTITGSDVQVELPSPVALGPDSIVNLADDSVDQIAVTGEGIEAGAYTRLTLTFQSGQTTEINVPVVAAEEEFSSVGPSPSESASPSESPTESPSASPSESPSASPSESAAP